MVTGSVMNNPEFVRSVEELGGLVVTDELCTSTRYWSDPVVLDGRSPLEAISRRYLNNFPCARMVPSDERFDRILQLTRDYKVDGVISQIIRYCVPYAHDLPLLTDRLKKAGVQIGLEEYLKTKEGVTGSDFSNNPVTAAKRLGLNTLVFFDAKSCHYIGNQEIEPVLKSLEDCVKIAVSGKIEG